MRDNRMYRLRSYLSRSHFFQMFTQIPHKFLSAGDTDSLVCISYSRLLYLRPTLARIGAIVIGRRQGL